MLLYQRVATKPSALELAPIACAAGFQHISKETTLAARDCIRSWLKDIISASIDIMQAEHRQNMKLSDVKGGISACISRITNSFAEVYGSSDLTVHIENGAYFIDDSAEPEPEELAAEQENDSDEDEGDDDFASESESDDEVASEDLLCEEELSASDDEDEASDFELTPSSGEESTPAELRDEIQNMEGTAPTPATEESQLYKPAISPDTITELIRVKLNCYRIDIRISLELQYFIHMWLEQRLLESFRAAPDCDIVLMTAVHNGKRMPLGVLNQLTKPQPVEPTPQPRAASTPAATGKKRRQALLTNYSIGSSEGHRMKGADMSPIAASSPVARAKRARPSDATLPADNSFLSNGEEDLDDTFDHNHQVASSSKDAAIPSHIGPELSKLRQSTDHLCNMLAEYNTKEPVVPLKQRIAELEAELAAVREQYTEAQAALKVVARHAQGILAFCDAEAAPKPSK